MLIARLASSLGWRLCRAGGAWGSGGPPLAASGPLSSEMEGVLPMAACLPCSLSLFSLSTAAAATAREEGTAGHAAGGGGGGLVGATASTRRRLGRGVGVSTDSGTAPTYPWSSFPRRLLTASPRWKTAEVWPPLLPPPSRGREAGESAAFPGTRFPLCFSPGIFPGPLFHVRGHVPRQRPHWYCGSRMDRVQPFTPSPGEER
mmetsp:Transcript_15405/g.43086  ORF Transcript_15405/g.43086 Transcript_15405/m.43086 type:complete len:203 (-) Transcript_15405:1388-1996(-)